MKRPGACVAVKRKSEKQEKTVALQQAEEMVDKKLSGSKHSGTKKSPKKKRASVSKKTEAQQKTQSTKSREERRQAVLRTVPGDLLKRFQAGCARCRWRKQCTISCWADRGYPEP